MAKKALLDVLEKTIGKYVVNLDAESLNVAIWSGTIELNALLLNVPAVNSELDRQAAEAPNLALPFRVTSGSFSSFQVDVPWAHLMSQPVVMRASGLSVELEPYDRTASADFLYAFSESETVRAKKIKDHRVMSIQLADDYRVQANALRKLAEQDLTKSSASAASTKDGGTSTFGARLARRIIENVQIEIRDVRVTLKGEEGVAGVVLDSVQLVTTDASGTPAFVDRTTGSNSQMLFLYKALKISGLGAYLDEIIHRHALSKLHSIREEGGEINATHSYILAPLSFEAKLRQADSNDCVDYPKYLLESELPSLAFRLSKVQLEVWQKIMAQIRPSLETRRPLFPEYRPTARIESGQVARDWWKYAVRCIGRLNGRRLWVEFFIAFQKRKQYIPLYKRHRHSSQCSWLTPLTIPEIADLFEIEQDRSISVEGLMTWRNIADAQVEKEREKDDSKKAALGPTNSLFSSIFGTYQSTPVASTAASDDPPVTLTLEEIKELESVTAERVADSELSKDSKLAILQFVLGSLEISLSSHESRQLVSLEMGRASTSVDINADGSFAFDFALDSLDILDRATPQTLYPYILCNQESTSLSRVKKRAFDFHVAKTKSGDQQLRVVLNTFEAIASPTLLLELKRFVSTSPVSFPAKATTLNPVLAQSMSGSVDLFYDATEGTIPKQISIGGGDLPTLGHHPTSDISQTLIEAWKVKAETKAAWVIDLDIHAPILVVPENCTDPRSNVLVFDLGRFRLLYGKIEPTKHVTQWFMDNTKSTSTFDTSTLDCGTLNISDLTFVVGKNNYWQRLVRKYESQDSIDREDATVFEPISMSLEMGIEASKAEGMPRVCMLGIIPLIALRVSPSQLSRMKRVALSWLKVWNDTMGSGTSDTKAGLLRDSDNHSAASSSKRKLSVAEEMRRSSTIVSSQNEEPIGSTPLLTMEFRLQRLSVVVASEEGSGMEAHLVSVAACFTSLSDSGTTINLSMGWFWVLDQLQHAFPRRQRLVVHSNLPKAPEDFALDGKYDILGELRRIGVFELDFKGSSELAAVTFTQEGTPQGSTIVDAMFSTLHVNWNPAAIKTILSTITRYISVLESNKSAEADSLGVLLSSPDQLQPRGIATEDSSDTVKTCPALRMKACMAKFVVTLNSARDDLPLFILSMATATLDLQISSGSTEMRLSMALDDMKVETPPMGRTNPAYRTILGVAPGSNDSLLKIRYARGVQSVLELSSDVTDDADVEALAQLIISPLRLVYIHSQILALAEYSTEGILGALTSRAASSAAAAAKDIATANSAKSVFRITSTGLQIVLPEAAYKSNHLVLATGVAEISYTSFPEQGGGQAAIELNDVILKDDSEAIMQDKSVKMTIDVVLPPDNVGTNDEQAMRVCVSITEAPFTVTRAQYTQILFTFDMNIGETDLFLREESRAEVVNVDGSSASWDESFLQGLTHSGVTAVANQRRMYVDITIIAFSLRLCAADADDPILQMTAVKAVVSMQHFVDEDRMKTTVTLDDLVCTDERIKSVGRQYRTLIYQTNTGREGTGSNDVFAIEYETRFDHKTSIALTIGSPRVVFLPDAVSDVLSFLKVDRPEVRRQSKALDCEATNVSEDSKFEVTTSCSDDQIEASFSKSRSRPSSSMEARFRTSRCSFVAVDLGSNALLPSRGSSKVGALSESIVFAGVFEANLESTSDLSSGSTISTDAQFHGTDLEIYTAYGTNLENPLQMLEPTKLSFYFAFGPPCDGMFRSVVDLRVAALSPLDLIFSMRNLALVNAITSSITESFNTEDGHLPSDCGTAQEPLNASQMKQIENLARALDVADDSRSASSSEHAVSSDTDLQSAPGSISMAENNRTISVKLTLPEAKLTVVNDLQGLDEALLRITARNMTFSSQFREGEQTAPSAPMFTAFDITIHTSVNADYFDVMTNEWKHLLLQPWEISTKAARSKSNRYKSPRPSTTVDVESYPCTISFSEQFLMNVAAANRMWSVYKTATSSAVDSPCQGADGSRRESLRLSLVASAARTLTTSLPYAVENHSGIDVTFVVQSDCESKHTCNNGTIEYFRFNPPKGAGAGGKRVYGQDLDYDKSLTLLIGSSELRLGNLDSQVGGPKKTLSVLGSVVFISVSKEEKTIVVHLTSGLDILNLTTFPVTVAAANAGLETTLGTTAGFARKQSLVFNAANASKPSRFFSVPCGIMESFWRNWRSHGRCQIALVMSPEVPDLMAGWKLEGKLVISCDRSRLNSQLVETFDVVCKPLRSSHAPAAEPTPSYLASFVFHASVCMELVQEGSYLAIEVKLEPRAFLENGLPVPLSVRTPMPHTFSSDGTGDNQKEAIHQLRSGEVMEIFTPGPSIAIALKCTEGPIAGTSTDWMHGFIDLPLVPEFRLPDPLMCELPFVRRTVDPLSLTGATGTEVMVTDVGVLARLSEDPTAAVRVGQVTPDSVEVSAPPVAGKDGWRKFLATVLCYGIDHTGDLLFEQVDSSSRGTFRRSNTDTETYRNSLRMSRQLSPPFGAYGSKTHAGRVSLLPGSHVLLRLLHLTMEGDEGMKRSQPFRVEDISICDGGVEATPVLWEDGSKSGFFAYRSLTAPYQSEVHIIPEFIVFNGSNSYTARVKQPGGLEMVIAPGKVAPLRTHSQETAMISVSYDEIEARTSPFRVDALGIRIAIVKFLDGTPIGSLPMQTVVGTKDSRLVVKLGEVNFGALSNSAKLDGTSWIERDFVRLRIQWTQLTMVLEEGRPIAEMKQAFIESAMDRIREATSPSELERGKRFPKDKETWMDARRRVASEENNRDGSNNKNSRAVCTIICSRSTIDWQRVFKDDEQTERTLTRDALRSPERSQLSVVVHNVQIRDETPNSVYPLVFDSTSSASFFDLCIRFKGPLNSELVKVDLFDLNLAHANGESQKIFVSTSEEFVWKLLDVTNRIIAAAGDMAGVDMELKWDEEQEGYVVSFTDKRTLSVDSNVKYTPPSSDRLYDIARARVSPFTMVLSFKRTPQVSRYTLAKGGKVANLINYFTKRVKFKIDCAELKFARYDARNIKGPPDRLLELLSTVYFSRAKLKFVTIMTATSLQDWKSLAARDEGDDEYTEGDILRVTGNIAGNTANYIFRHAGRGLGQGVSTVTSTLGDRIEDATGAIGVRSVGAGVNSIVSGVGEGVSSTISGVGSGAGKVFQGAGQGAGAVFGGLTGGALLIGKGITKGITTGDGRAVVSGVSDGVSSLGAGVGHGIESVVTGTAEGVLSVGQGLFSGVKSVGKGIGGAFRGKPPDKKKTPPR